MWKRAILPLAAVTIVSHAVASDVLSRTEPRVGPRIGAVCMDGWHSSATGSGACSHHGGVHHWIHSRLPPEAKNPEQSRQLASVLQYVGNGAAAAGGLTLLLSAGRRVRPKTSKTAITTDVDPPVVPTSGSGIASDLSTAASLQRSLPLRPTSRHGRCQSCGAPLVRRTRRADGRRFLGCSRYPSCCFTRSMSGRRKARKRRWTT